MSWDLLHGEEIEEEEHDDVEEYGIFLDYEVIGSDSYEPACISVRKWVCALDPRATAVIGVLGRKAHLALVLALNSQLRVISAFLMHLT